MRILLTITIVLTFCIIAAAQDKVDPAAQLDSIKSELEQKRSEFQQLGQKERSELLNMRSLEEEIALRGKLMLKYKRQIENLHMEIAQQNIDLENALILREYRREHLNDRLRQIYKLSSQQRTLKFLFNESPSAVLTAFKNLSLLVQYDKQLAQKYGGLTAEIKSEIAKLESNLARLSILQTDSEKETENQKKAVSNRKKLLEKLRKDKEYVAASIERLEQDALEVSSIIEDLEKRQIVGPPKVETQDFMALKGQLLWPLKGELIRGFGAKRDKRGIVISSPGIDIKAPFGADVAAVADGKVIYVSWLRGYGQFVILDHSESYYTLYANLSDIFVEAGDNVFVGEIIGQVGDSGSLEGPKLHFEVRHKKTQLDPLEWLVE